MTLLARVFRIDISVCPRCAGPMRVTRAVTTPEQIAAELRGARPPRRCRSPSPPVDDPNDGALDASVGAREVLEEPVELVPLEHLDALHRPLVVALASLVGRQGLDLGTDRVPVEVATGAHSCAFDHRSVRSPGEPNEGWWYSHADCVSVMRWPSS